MSDGVADFSPARRLPRRSHLDRQHRADGDCRPNEGRFWQIVLKKSTIAAFCLSQFFVENVALAAAVHFLALFGEKNVPATSIGRSQQFLGELAPDHGPPT
jgi:hypothetical protein